MDEYRQLALQLAHDAEERHGSTPPAVVVARAKVYLNFLLGVADAEPDDAKVSGKRGSSGF